MAKTILAWLLTTMLLTTASLTGDSSRKRLLESVFLQVHPYPQRRYSRHFAED